MSDCVQQGVDHTKRCFQSDATIPRSLAVVWRAAGFDRGAPVYVKGTNVVTVTGTEDPVDSSRITCYNNTTGASIWSVNLPATPGPDRSWVLGIAGDHVICCRPDEINLSQVHVYGLNIANGTLAWTATDPFAIDIPFVTQAARQHPKICIAPDGKILLPLGALMSLYSNTTGQNIWHPTSGGFGVGWAAPAWGGYCMDEAAATAFGTDQSYNPGPPNPGPPEDPGASMRAIAVATGVQTSRVVFDNIEGLFTGGTLLSSPGSPPRVFLLGLAPNEPVEDVSTMSIWSFTHSPALAQTPLLRRGLWPTNVGQWMMHDGVGVTYIGNPEPTGLQPVPENSLCTLDRTAASYDAPLKYFVQQPPDLDVTIGIPPGPIYSPAFIAGSNGYVYSKRGRSIHGYLRSSGTDSLIWSLYYSNQVDTRFTLPAVTGGATTYIYVNAGGFLTKYGQAPPTAPPRPPIVFDGATGTMQYDLDTDTQIAYLTPSASGIERGFTTATWQSAELKIFWSDQIDAISRTLQPQTFVRLFQIDEQTFPIVDYGSITYAWARLKFTPEGVKRLKESLVNNQRLKVLSWIGNGPAQFSYENKYFSVAELRINTTGTYDGVRAAKEVTLFGAAEVQ